MGQGGLARGSMADSQKMASKVASGGQRIDNHSFWAGKPGKDSRFPDGAHTKDESSAEGAGSLMSYEDTTEKIKASQEKAKGKIHSLPRRPLDRN